MAQAQQRGVFVLRVRRGNINGIDFGVGGESLIGAVAVRDMMLGAERVGLLLRTRADRLKRRLRLTEVSPRANEMAIEPGPSMPQRTVSVESGVKRKSPAGERVLGVRSPYRGTFPAADSFKKQFGYIFCYGTEQSQ